MQSAFRIRGATGRACIALWCFSAACLPDCHSLKHRICKAAKDGKSVELLLFFLLSLPGHVCFCCRCRSDFLLSLRGHVYFLAVVAGARLLSLLSSRGRVVVFFAVVPAGAFFLLSLRGRFFLLSLRGRFVLLSLRGVLFLLSLREPGFTHSLASWVRATTTKNNIKQLQQKNTGSCQRHHGVSCTHTHTCAQARKPHTSRESLCLTNA